MKLGFSVPGMARVSARRPWIVVITWLIALVAAGMLAGTMNVSSDMQLLDERDSATAQDLLDERMGGEPVIETVIITSSSTTVDDPAFRQVVEEATGELRGLDGVVTSATSYYEARDAGAPNAEGLVSQDRHSTLIPVELGTDFDAAVDEADLFLDTVEEAGAEGFETYAVGDVSITEEFSTTAEEDMREAELLGLPVALIILVVVFGALIAAGVPIVLGIASIVIALGLSALVSQVTELSFFTANMISMIGLAVGIDYALFIIERYREERRHGADKLAAIEIAAGTASKAVLFSGMTVVLALAGMFLVPISIFGDLSTGAVLVVVVAVAAMLTLVPALLSLLGDKIDWPRRPKAAVSRESVSERRGFWARITAAVMRRPVIAVVGAVILLAGATIPYFDMQTGQNGAETLPPGDVATGYEILSEQFYAGMSAPVRVVIDGDAADADVQAGIDRFVNALGTDAQFGQVSSQVSQDGSLTMLSFPLATDANAEVSYDAIDRLREETIPATFDGSGAEVYLAGETAFNDDMNAALEEYTPIVFAFVLGLSFILLMVAFRSIVVPFTAIIMNLLSVGAAYGLLVLFFQHGWGELLGLEHTPTIDAWVPLFLFSILFGLSMDYHVFLLSRIREHFDLTGNNDEAVAVGLQSTAKIITGAALIMVAVFSAFAAGRLVAMQQVGFGLAVAVLLDATIVRSMLVPATMKLLGNWNWYLPRWLSWLPKVSIEGQPVHVPAAAPAPATVAYPAGAGDD